MSVKNDINGKESSKRTWASRMLWTAILIVWVYVLIWVYTIVKDKALADMPDALIQMWFGLAGGGLTALGLTLGERIKQNAKNADADSIPGGGLPPPK